MHEQKTKLLANWDTYLASMIYASRGMGSMSAAKRMARVRSHLVDARNRARILVSNSRQQAAGPIGQPVETQSTTVTKGNQPKTTKTCQRRKHNRNRNTGNRRRWIVRTRTDSTSTVNNIRRFFSISFHFISRPILYKNTKIRKKQKM